jgi:hypothetical protein
MWIAYLCLGASSAMDSGSDSPGGLDTASADYVWHIDWGDAAANVPESIASLARSR